MGPVPTPTTRCETTAVPACREVPRASKGRDKHLASATASRYSSKPPRLTRKRGGSRALAALLT